MTKTQIQQLVVALLLILFAGVFLLSKKAPGPSETPVPVSQPAVMPENPARATEAAVPAAPAASDLSIPRDVFLLPTLLIQRMQQQEQETLDLEQQNRLHEQASRVQTSVPQPLGTENLLLQGIFWGGAKPQAIINRKIVSVGDQVENAEVTEITRDSVKLSVDGNELELKPESFRSGDNKKAGGPQMSSPDANMR